MRRALVALAVVGGFVLSACGGSGGLAVRARFTDVGSLATQAPVLMNDVRVGEVKAITLDGNEALVTMSIDPAADVPQGVIARVRSTSLLGERIVDLQIPAGLPADAPPLRDGAVISDTVVRPELEDLVREGTDVLAPIAASEVATLVDEGARGFAGKGDQLHQLLGDLQSIVHAYAGRTGEIRSVITSLNQLNTTLASHAKAQGLSVQNSDRAISSLQEESAQLQAAIHSLVYLARGGRGILEAHSAEMNRFFVQLRVIAGVLAAEQGDLAQILAYAPKHNRNTQLVNYREFNQVLQDFVICGINDDPSNPARTCKG